MTRATLRVAWAAGDHLASVSDANLGTQEIERTSRFKSAKLRQQYVASRAMLRALLADHTGSPAASFNIYTDRRGKPICSGGPAVSISHSGDTVACAVMDATDIGIDVEFPTHSRDVAAIAERYFVHQEAEWLAAGPPERFYMLWVLKESWLKATGAGIAGGLDKLCCTVVPPRIVPEPDSAPCAALRLYTLGDGLLGIAALDSSPDEIEVRRWLPAQGAFVASDEAALIASHDANA